MKRARFTEEQIIGILRENDGITALSPRPRLTTPPPDLDAVFNNGEISITAALSGEPSGRTLG